MAGSKVAKATVVDFHRDTEILIGKSQVLITVQKILIYYSIQKAAHSKFGFFLI